ncbi:NAD-dependent protein deacylase [Saccharophagus degradans]|uniref:Sir2 family NAD+-dependent deacetylase n=1 Tax=Saccharophagus degradans TaxID=86304 RepID=UPI0024780CDD|nr:Sir2 family NAD+-dependent deacetylase [Saccharophagus degradans]WGO97090.1 NAD-dependent protein deacylase [Saccharophagus degradans]
MKQAKDYKRIVVLTGAGVSAESGLKTFRDNNGLWENHRVEDVATPEAYARNPELVQKFYNARRSQLLTAAQPNKAHTALGEFEQHFSGEFLLVTQNVDNLHELGGSKNLIHMHGELLKARCPVSEKVSNCTEDLTDQSLCECCTPPNLLRPHIVWFGEMPLAMDTIEQALCECDLFVSIGTSGNVYPAAGFVELAASYGAATVELNLDASANSRAFDTSLQGPASELVPLFFACS